MRQVDPKILEERKHKILQAVIHHYIKTGKPVGSNILVSDYEFDLSTATIRNFMADLEDAGYLTHPHTSAGRIPTDKGYRSYVDSLIELQRLAIEEEARVKKEYLNRTKELEELLVQTSKVLSALSQYTGFVLTPKRERNKIKHIELIQIDASKVLVIMVTHTGLVNHHMISAGSLPKGKISKLNVILNDALFDLTLSEAKAIIAERIENAEREERELFSFAKSLSREIFNIEDEIYIDGATNMLSLPEFRDYEPIRNILGLNEEKNMLSHMFGENLNSDKVRVVIGSESMQDGLRNLSVVSSVYKDGKRPIGVLGIIGPKRMQYPKMMALVGTVSKMLNKLLTRFGG